LLYQLVAGRPPFVAPDVFAVLQQHLHAPVPPMPISVPPELEAVLARALEKDVLRRYSSAAEFADALVKTIASCIAISAVAMSFRPRVVAESDAASIYGPIIRADDGRLVSPA